MFVEITEEDWADFLTYELAENWLALDGNPGVYYREVDDTEEDQIFPVLEDNAVVVDENDATKAALNALNAPKLVFTAYAVQRENVDTVAEAWAIAKP